MKPRSGHHSLKFIPVLLFFTAATGSALAQGINAFDVGGGLLPAPAPTTGQVQAGTGAAAAGAPGGAGGPQQTTIGRGGGNAVDAGTGPLFTADVALRFTNETSTDEPTETYVSGFYDLGVFTETRNQSFRFNTGGELRLLDGDPEIVTPFARLDYTLENRPTRFAIALNWRESDVGDQFLPAEFDGDDLIIDGGTQSVHSARISLETGRTHRFGTTTSIGFRQLDYTDTIDPNLVNSTTLDARTDLRFSLSRRVELGAFLSWAEESMEDAVDTVETTLSYGVNLDVLIDRAWRGDLALTFRDLETETIGGITNEDRYTIALGATRDLRNGTLRFATNAQVDDDDTIVSFEAIRALELANGASLSGSAGLAFVEDGDVLPVLGLGYSHEFLRGSVLTLSLNQAGGLTDDGDGVLRTTFNAQLSQELTRVSSLSLGGALASVSPQSGADPDTLAVNLSLAYTHDLTEDWAFAARASTRINYEDSTETGRESRFSLGLERSFSFRP